MKNGNFNIKYDELKPIRDELPNGVREILESWFNNKPIRNEYLIVENGSLAGAGAHSYSKGNTTKGSDEASKYKS